MIIYRIKYLNIATSIFIIGFFITDITQEYISVVTKGWHFYSELFFVLLLFYLLIHQIREIYIIGNKLSSATERLSRIQGEIGDLIDQQLNEWNLTKAEKSVTWMVIKGFSFKEIAEIRQVSEKTVHQQTASIYKKSGVKNRHELMGGFLDDFVNFNK
jgi:DNA-binding CsgD family transcriptional regulator